MGMASTGLQEESAGKMGVIMWKTTLLEKVSLLKEGKEKKKKEDSFPQSGSHRYLEKK